MNYNEYKYLVTREKLPYILGILETLYGSSDPFPSGIVDSIYYDTLDRRSYLECLNGDNSKTKFRIRGYGDGSFHQLHMKGKDLFVVKKIKASIQPVSIRNGLSPEWTSLIEKVPGEQKFGTISAMASSYGLLIPAIRVRYRRFRFRSFDFRMTLDTQIEVSSFGNGHHSVAGHSILPVNILEIKTVDIRPHLPLLELSQLPQISFSKFFLGLESLSQREGQAS